MGSDHILLYSKWYAYSGTEQGGAAFDTSLFIPVLICKLPHYMSSDHIQLYSKWYTYFGTELGGAAFGTSLFYICT